MPHIKKNFHKLYWAIFLSFCLLSVYFRFWGLGRWSLAIDEYFITKSISSILSNGLPTFECGGYYVRGILQQYLTAPILALSSDPEWAVRLIPVIANVLTMPAVFLIGRRIGGYAVAFVATLLFCFSTVELEMARFARMYAPFQALFVWQIYFLLIAIKDKQQWAYNVVLALAFASIFIYQGAIFLAVICLYPLLLKKIKINRYVVLFIFIIFLLISLNLLTDFRSLGVTTTRVDVAKSGSSIIFHPNILLLNFSSKIEWFLFFLVPLPLFIRSFYYVWLTKKADLATSLVWTVFFVSLLFNQLALASCFLILGMLTGLIENYDLSLKSIKKDEPIFTAMIGLFVYWAGQTLLISDDRLFDSLKALLEFPNIYDHIFWPWYLAFPTFTLIMSFCVVFSLWFSVRFEDDHMKIILCVTLVMCMIVGTLETTYIASRYTFFIYPLFLLVVSYFATRVIFHYTNRIIFPILVMSLILYYAEDFNLNHFINVSQPEVNFRKNYEKDTTILYYKRFDFENTAKYINAHMKSGDIVVSFSNVVDFYLHNPLTYRYLDKNSVEFNALSACDGEREIWSNARLIHTPDELETIVQGNPGVWVVSSEDTALPREAHLFNSRYSDHLRYTSIDGSLKVFRF